MRAKVLAVSYTRRAVNFFFKRLFVSPVHRRET